MYEFEWGFEENQEIKMTKEYRETEERLNDLCQQYTHLKRLPYGWYILPYYESYGIPKPPRKGSKNYRSYYLYTNFLKPNPNFYEYADIYLEHKKDYDGARRIQERYVVQMDRIMVKPLSCKGKSANYFD